MILQLQAKVHGLGNLGVSACTYPIFTEFKAKKLWGESFYLRTLLCFAKLRALLLKERPPSKFRGILLTCVLCFVACLVLLRFFALCGLLAHVQLPPG